MADRSVAKPGEDPEEPREIVELDKDERWQTRLEEARARREIALAEKAAQPQKIRKKPWEEDDGAAAPIEPVIQAKPDDEPDLDFADRMEVMREAPKDEDIVAAPPPAPERSKPKIKRPPEPDPSPFERPVYNGPPVARRNRRPFGLGLVVLAFSLVPLAQMAPPLDKGPEQPQTPFFGLPPALGLTTSLVWRPETFPVNNVQKTVPGPKLGAAPVFEAAPLTGAGRTVGGGPVLVSPSPSVDTQVAWTGVTRPDLPGPTAGLTELGSIQPLSALSPMQSPRPQPNARATVAAPELAPGATNETTSGVNRGTTPDTPTIPGDPEILGEAAPDVGPALVRSPLSPTVKPEPKPTATPITPSSSLNLTILVPEGGDLSSAEAIASDITTKGHTLNRIRPVDVSISTRNVRYFHNDDRPAATRLAKTYGAEVKDFTWFRPSPEKGTTELWLSGSAGSPRVAEPAETTQVFDPEPPVLIIRRKPTLIERFLTGSNADIEIVVPNPNGIFDGSDIGGGN